MGVFLQEAFLKRFTVQPRNFPQRVVVVNWKRALRSDDLSTDILFNDDDGNIKN